MDRLFGTDGIRGVANTYPITPEMALQIGRATAYLCKKTQGKRHKVVLGKDTRISSSMLEHALAAGVVSMGVDVLTAGEISTPGIAFLARNLNADAGIVISASHNPFPDNGIKIFSGTGYKLSDQAEDEIQALIESESLHTLRPTGADIGRIIPVEDAARRYIEFCKSCLPKSHNFAGLKLVLDCANGALSKIAPVVFSELGAALEIIHCNPDGTNINDHCGSQHPEDLVTAVLKNRADAGLAFDGDGDRLIAVDEKGNVMSGDHVLAICARMYKDLGLLKNNIIVATVMSNFGLFTALKEMGIREAISKVGDRYVLEMMQEKGAVLGGEQSGHIIFLDHHTSGDGMVTALQLLRAVHLYGKPLSELAKIMTALPQKIVNVEVKNKPPLENIVELQTAIAKAEAELKNRGRCLVRYSGTQPLCRIMVEGPTEEITEQLALMLSETVRRYVG